MLHVIDVFQLKCKMFLTVVVFFPIRSIASLYFVFLSLLPELDEFTTLERAAQIASLIQFG